MKRTPLARKTPLARTAMKRKGGGLHPKQKAPTVTERARMTAIKVFGCYPCFERGLDSAPELHHILSGGRRMGHEFTIPLCPWHHQGRPPGDMSNKEARAKLGPSMALEKRAFVSEFGTELEIKARVDLKIGRES